MSWEVIDRVQVTRAAVEVAERVAGMVGRLVDTDIPIPGSDWTVGETAAHLEYTNIGLGLIARGLDVPYGDGTLGGLAEANADSFEFLTDRDGTVLGPRILTAVRVFAAEAVAQPDDRVTNTPMGTMGIDALASYVLTHNLMHGCAIAAALGAASPFRPEHAPLMWPFLRVALERTLDADAAAGLTASIEVTVEGAFSGVLVFDEGRLTVTAAAGPGTRSVDCHVSIDPETFFLWVVKLVTTPEAIQRGGLKVWGPRPELGSMLPDLFTVP
jgi:hypothetical protein